MVQSMKHVEVSLYFLIDKIETTTLDFYTVSLDMLFHS